MPVSKTGIVARLSGVRIPPSPPFIFKDNFVPPEFADSFSTLIPFLKEPNILAALITFALEIIRRNFVQPKASIIWGATHGFTFLLPSNQSTEPHTPKLNSIQTGGVLVRNNGRAPARNVEFYFNYKPEHYQIWPIIQHTTDETPDGRFVIKIDFLKEKEFFNIELIQGNSNLPEILSVRALEGVCSNVPMGPQQIFPAWFNYTALLLFVIGIYQSLVWIFKILQA